MLRFPLPLCCALTPPVPLWPCAAEALLALKEALNNHPAFDGFKADPNNPAFGGLPSAPWTLKAEPGVPAYLRTPCSDSGTWAWVGCNTAGRVIEM